MPALHSHLSVLQAAAAKYATRPVFRLARTSEGSDVVDVWEPVTYQTFLEDVELAARYWYSKLSNAGIPPKSVVGLWLAGMDYADVVHIYGMSRAGYIPQLFSLRLPNPVVVFELLAKAQAKAIIFDASFRDVVREPPVFSHLAIPLSAMSGHKGAYLPPFPIPTDRNDLLLVFHTSGSTSGSPKLVRCRAYWVDSMVAKSAQVGAPKDPRRQDVCTWMGSMCHIGQTFMLVGSLQHGSCTLRPTKIPFSSDELVDMIKRCGLNRLHQFATFLSTHIKRATQNPKLLAMLRSLDLVLYSGLPLPREDEEFSYRAGVPLINLFGSTECGAMLRSQGGHGMTARLLRPLQGVKYAFMPISSSAPKTEAGHVNAGNQLLELVILSDSPDCPDVALRRESDGHFHTGDLFQEMAPHQYLFRGRDDDWIKSQTSLRCDTRAIEDNVRATCGELVEECIVVGSGRPSPALFVEPRDIQDPERLKKEIIRRTRQFHSRRYIHERITSVDFIIVVNRMTLPRTATKGNIRRQAVEEAYMQQLDELYGMDA